MKRAMIFLFMFVSFLAILFTPKQAYAMTAVINIPERYSSVMPGERVYFETEIKWPENDMRRDLRIEYSVVDENNEEIAYLKTLKAIETQASFMDFINIPQTATPGKYTIYLDIKDYEDMHQRVGVSFIVLRKKQDSVNTYLMIVLGIVGIIAVLVSVELFILIKKGGFVSETDER